MSTVFSVLLDPAILLQIVQFLYQYDVMGVSIIDVAVSDIRYRLAWLEMLR
jgi:hypothetical protein